MKQAGRMLKKMAVDPEPKTMSREVIMMLEGYVEGLGFS